MLPRIHPVGTAQTAGETEAQYLDYFDIVDKKTKETPEKQRLQPPCRELLGDGQQRDQADGCTRSNNKNDSYDNHKNDNDGQVDGCTGSLHSNNQL